MSAIARSTELLTPSSDEKTSDQSSVISISVNARIDYILRFSKHAICVIDENVDVYSQAASEFLSVLPQDHNAAFVSVSSKLNDIQVRSRFIEQLFPGAKFDPEQALTVSLIKLASEQGQPITAIVEHGQLLSRQLLHELCQLAKMAKNNALVINIVLFAQQDVGKLLAANKSLFDNKISLLTATSGQLIAIDAKQFKTKSSFFTLTFTKAALLSLALLSVLLALVVIWLYQSDSLSLSALPESAKTLTVEQKDTFVTPELASPTAPLAKDNLALSANTVQTSATNALHLVTEQPLSEPAKQVAASTHDIYLAVIGQVSKPTISQTNSDNMAVLPTLSAQPLDVLQAIEWASDSTPGATPDENWQEKKYSETVVLDKKHESLKVAPSAVGISSDYFLSAKAGYVIQISGFSYQSVFSDFIRDYPGLKYAGYNRLLNGQKFLVITSVIYPNKALAGSAIADLPEAIVQRGPWVKSVAAIKNEIRAFQTAQ